MIYIGVRYFQEKRAENLRTAMQAEIAAIVQDAVRYYNAPSNAAGGSGSFSGYQGISGPRSKAKGKKARVTTGKLLLDIENGAYSLIAVASDSVILEGVGDPLGDDGVNPIRIRAIVKSQRTYHIILN